MLLSCNICILRCLEIRLRLFSPYFKDEDEGIVFTLELIIFKFKLKIIYSSKTLSDFYERQTEATV